MDLNLAVLVGLVILISDLYSPGLSGGELGSNTKSSNGLKTLANNYTTDFTALLPEPPPLPGAVYDLSNITTPADVNILPTMVSLIHEVTLELPAVAVNPYAMPPFRGGPEMYLSMAKWNHLVCGKSVCNKTLQTEKCGNLLCNDCHCDEGCLRYGDCCPDFYLTSSPQELQVTFSCISKVFIGSRQGQSERYKMVSSCPELESPTDDLVIAVDKCYASNSTRIQDNIPVYSSQTKLHFKNVDCAKCNGISNAVPWYVNAFCEKYVDMSWVSSPDDLLRLIRQEQTCAVHFQPPKFSNPRECRFTGDTVKTCNVSGNWMDYDPDIARACSLYSQPVSYLSIYYENIFCLSCNGHQLSTYPYCYDKIVVPGVAPFSVLLDFRATVSDEREQVFASCPDTSVYDTKAEICRPLFCPRGKIVKNHTCSSIFTSARGLGYILHISVTPNDREYVLMSNYDQLPYQLFKYMTNDLFEPVFTVVDVNLTFVTTNGSHDAHVQELDVQFSLVVGAVIPPEEVERRLSDLVKNKFWFYEADTKSPLYFDVKWRTGLSNERLQKHVFSPRRIDVEPIGVLRYEVVHFSDENLNVEVPVAFRRDVLSYILVNDLLMCNIIELNSTEYTVVNSSQIFINSTGEHLDEGQYVWNGDRVRVCTNYTGDIPDSQTHFSTTLYDQIEVTLTLICTCLSLCGLAVTLVIYLAIPSVRQQLPGKNNMFLFVNLFLAQLLFLTGSSAKVSTPGCRALGIVIHYFWLATFCWKVICAYHMYRLFTSPLKVLDQSKSLLRYILFSHLFPALWIIGVVSINLGLSNLVRIGYADRQDLCFLSSTLDVAFGFAVPVALVIVSNVYFFSRVVYVLQHRPKIERHVTKSDVKATVIYLKMSLILGFTWALGFFAVATNERGMWYVFTVINASNGLFVFISFGLKNISPGILTRGRLTGNSAMTMSSSKTYTTSSGLVSRQHPNWHSEEADGNRSSPSKPLSL